MSAVLVHALDAAYLYVGALAVISFLLLVISGRDPFEEGGYNRVISIVVVVSFVTTFVINGIVKAAARHEVLSYLDGLNTAMVSINGDNVADPGAVLAMLRSITHYWAHHSHCEGRILIEIQSDRGRLVIRLGRDSGRSDEYWIYYPRYYVSNIDDIDRIRTHLLDKCSLR